MVQLTQEMKDLMEENYHIASFLQDIYDDYCDCADEEYILKRMRRTAAFYNGEEE